MFGNAVVVVDVLPVMVNDSLGFLIRQRQIGECKVNTPDGDTQIGQVIIEAVRRPGMVVVLLLLFRWLVDKILGISRHARFAKIMKQGHNDAALIRNERSQGTFHLQHCFGNIAGVLKQAVLLT